MIRHPKIASRSNPTLWSHHEKIAVVDQSTAFIGGIDLAYGRYDTQAHSMTDTEERNVWKGKDYINLSSDVEEFNKPVII